MPTRPTMPLPDAARRLRVAYQVAHRLLLVGELDGERDGRAWRVYVDSVDAALAKRQAGSAPAAA
jgi:hypothetical protein